MQYPELLEQAHTFLIEQDVDVTNRAQIMEMLQAKWRAAKQDVSNEEVQKWLRGFLNTILEWISEGRYGLS